jgi:hypothetical protein
LGRASTIITLSILIGCTLLLSGCVNFTSGTADPIVGTWKPLTPHIATANTTVGNYSYAFPDWVLKFFSNGTYIADTGEPIQLKNSPNETDIVNFGRSVASGSWNNMGEGNYSLTKTIDNGIPSFHDNKEKCTLKNGQLIFIYNTPEGNEYARDIYIQA